MPLTDTLAYILKDTDGLALFVSANGTKSWHFRFRLAGKQPRISFGTYAEVSLKQARELRDQARGLVAKGVDPRAHRREERRAAVLAADLLLGLFRHRSRGHGGARAVRRVAH